MILYFNIRIKISNYISSKFMVLKFMDNKSPNLWQIMSNAKCVLRDWTDQKHKKAQKMKNKRESQ